MNSMYRKESVCVIDKVDFVALSVTVSGVSVFTADTETIVSEDVALNINGDAVSKWVRRVSFVNDFVSVGWAGLSTWCIWTGNSDA